MKWKSILQLGFDTRLFNYECRHWLAPGPGQSPAYEGVIVVTRAGPSVDRVSSYDTPQLIQTAREEF